MTQQIGEQMKTVIRRFRLPRYEEIPDVGLYLEQVVKYIGEFCQPLAGVQLTSSMVSNYVKKGLVSNPVKKQYDRDQIAYLLFIAIAKSVLPLDHIQTMIELQLKSYPKPVAYNYFCREMENIIQAVFGLKELVEFELVDPTQEKLMLRNTIITVAHKIYLEQFFCTLQEQYKQEGGSSI